MKKSILLILLSSLLLLSGCTNERTPLEEIYNVAKIQNVDKVFIQYGATGASKTITNEEQINELLSLINKIELTPIDEAEGWGYLYLIDLFDGKKEFRFSMNQIGKTFYNSNPDIQPIIDNYYKQLDIVEQ